MNLWQIYIGIHHPYEMHMRFLMWESRVTQKGGLQGALPLVMSPRVSHVRLVGQRRVEVSVVLDEQVQRLEQIAAGHAEEELAYAHVVGARRVEGDDHVQDGRDPRLRLLEQAAQEPAKRERVLARGEAVEALADVVGKARQVVDPRVGEHGVMVVGGCARDGERGREEKCAPARDDEWKPTPPPKKKRKEKRSIWNLTRSQTAGHDGMSQFVNVVGE